MQPTDTLTAVRSTPHLRAALSTLRAVAPHAWIGAGCLRNAVWDIAHGRSPALPNDVDVAFLDWTDTGFEEQRLERALQLAAPDLPWEARNQARMHRRHGHPPYPNLSTALSHWVETATAVAVRQTGADRYEVCAPYGLYDLEHLVLRPVPSHLNDPQAFSARVSRKRWLERWPMLTLVPPQHAAIGI